MNQRPQRRFNRQLKQIQIDTVPRENLNFRTCNHGQQCGYLRETKDPNRTMALILIGLSILCVCCLFWCRYIRYCQRKKPKKRPLLKKKPTAQIYNRVNIGKTPPPKDYDAEMSKQDIDMSLIGLNDDDANVTHVDFLPTPMKVPEPIMELPEQPYEKEIINEELAKKSEDSKVEEDEAPAEVERPPTPKVIENKDKYVASRRGSGDLDRLLINDLEPELPKRPEPLQETANLGAPRMIQTPQPLPVVEPAPLIKGIETLTIEQEQQSNEPVSVIPPVDPAPVKHIQEVWKKPELGGSERTLEPDMNNSKASLTNISEDTRALPIITVFKEKAPEPIETRSNIVAECVFGNSQADDDIRKKYTVHPTYGLHSQSTRKSDKFVPKFANAPGRKTIVPSSKGSKERKERRGPTSNEEFQQKGMVLQRSSAGQDNNYQGVSLAQRSVTNNNTQIQTNQIRQQHSEVQTKWVTRKETKKVAAGYQMNNTDHGKYYIDNEHNVESIDNTSIDYGHSQHAIGFVERPREDIQKKQQEDDDEEEAPFY